MLQIRLPSQRIYMFLFDSPLHDHILYKPREVLPMQDFVKVLCLSLQISSWNVVDNEQDLIFDFSQRSLYDTYGVKCKSSKFTTN